MCQKCKFKQCLGVGSFWKWWGCMLAEASRPNGFEATRSNISLRKWGSQDNNWGDMCCFQSIKPKLSHRVIKLNSTDFCVIIVIIYHLNYWSTLRRQLKWEQRKLLLYKDVMGVWQSGWAHREEAETRWREMGLQLGIGSAHLLALRGRSCTLISDRLLSIWQTQGSLHSWWQQRAKLKSDTGPVQSCMEQQAQAVMLPIRAFIFPVLPQIGAFSSHWSHWPLLASLSTRCSQQKSWHIHWHVSWDLSKWDRSQVPSLCLTAELTPTVICK